MVSDSLVYKALYYNEPSYLLSSVSLCKNQIIFSESKTEFQILHLLNNFVLMHSNDDRRLSAVSVLLLLPPTTYSILKGAYIGRCFCSLAASAFLSSMLNSFV